MTPEYDTPKSKYRLIKDSQAFVRFGKKAFPTFHVNAVKKKGDSEFSTST